MKNASKNSMSKLKIKGNEVDDKTLIEEEILSFFTALFNGHHDKDLFDTGSPFVPDFSKLDTFLTGLSRLPDADKEELEHQMTLDDLEYVVKQSANKESPGLDGLSYEFYKATFNIIKFDLLKVFQCQLDRKNINSSNERVCQDCAQN